MSETFKYVSEVNLDRALVWHEGGLDEWSPNDWAVALAGESGEQLEAVLDLVIGSAQISKHIGLLCNLSKKLKRIEDGINQAENVDYKKLIDHISTEVGDTYLYMDLFCQRLGLDIYEDCIRPTFNRVSERENFQQMLETSRPPEISINITPEVSVNVPEHMAAQIAKEDEEQTRYRPGKYRILHQYGTVYVKDAQFFEDQGGLTEDWGKNWVEIEAHSIADARKKGMDTPDVTKEKNE